MSRGRGAFVRLAALLLVLASAGCARLPLYTSLPVEERPSPNFSERRPNYVVLHHTTNDTAERALATLTDPLREVSAHYLIGRDGRIFYLVDEKLRAWHAGESWWGGNDDLNSSSIGIELDNNGDEPFPEVQIAALLALLADLRERWGIPAANFLGHGDVAPGRKVDPSAWFPWRRLAQSGFGLWCDPPWPPAPEGAADEMLLTALGYDVSRLEPALAAFRRHYASTDSDGRLSDAERAMLQCLIRQRTRDASGALPPAAAGS